MKNYKKLVTGSLLAALIVSTPLMSFAKENEKDNGNKSKTEQSNNGNQNKSWFMSNWFGNRSPKITTAPVISDLIAVSTKSNKATIKWSTDVRSNSFVWYSTVSPVNTSVNPNIKRGDRDLKHKFELKKLQPNTKYYVIAGSANTIGKTLSTEISFTTGSASTNISIPVITSATGTATMKVGEIANFTFNAYDPQNKTLTYEVNFGDGSTISPTAFNQAVTLNHTYTNTGTYIVKFTVTNSDGRKATYPMQIKVTPTVTTDTTAPVIGSFVIPATSTTLSVNITTFTATDATGVTGYKLTETSTTPLASDSGWLSTAPTTYTFTTPGAKTLYAWAKDANGNISSSVNDSVIITLADTTAPVISGITTSVTGSSATISWTTNELATSNIYYSTGTPVDINAVATPNVKDATLVTNHTLSIPSLASSTLYHFILKSADGSNNVVLSSESTFTTN